MSQGGRAVPEGDETTVFLLDGTYTVFRAFYAISALNAPDGTPTNGVFGFVSTVRKLIEEHGPDHFAVAFDLEGPTFRDELFDEYKANRAEPPDELRPQFALARRACEVMGWPVLTAEGFEADDVLGTLAEKARDAGHGAVIVTSDKDLYQLVGPRIRVLNPRLEDRILDESGVEEVFGVPPERVVDVLALMGDKVDNVPGVSGIGEKGAKALVSRYGPVDDILARARDFQRVWEGHQKALDALAADDRDALAAAAEAMREPAQRLAETERALGGDDGAELAEKFEAIAALAERVSSEKSAALRRTLRAIEKKTQPRAWLALAEREDDARFSLELVTVRRDAPVALDLEAMRPGRPSAEEAVEFFRSLGFRRLTEEMEGLSGAPAAGDRAADGMECEIVETSERLEALAEALRGTSLLAVDTETDSLDPRQARLVGISLATSDRGGAYVPVRANGARRGLSIDELAPLRSVLEDPSVPKAGQNLKFDRAVLRGSGIALEGIAFDTLLAAQLLEPSRSVSHKLDDLAWRHLGLRMISYADVAGSGAGERTLADVDVESVARYAVEDAVVAWRLAQHLRGELEREGLVALFEGIEVPLVAVLEEMEAIGIRLDTDVLASMSTALAKELGRLESEIHELAGHEFNINSPQQLRGVLFDELGLEPTGRRTSKTRAHSTGQEALEALAAEHPLPGKVVEYREVSKLKSTYVDALPRLVSPEDGRLHTSFHQLGAATGRLSSSDPNLQNIPTRTPAGHRIREAFVPEPGWRLVSADYSQMELRVLAHLSGDASLIEAFSEGHDIHRYTAALVTGLPLDEVGPEDRARAKAVNFGIVYGMSEFRLAREQGMSVPDARAFIDAYFERYPSVRAYIDGVIEGVQESGVVRTLFSRLRPFPELASGASTRLNRMQREQLLRQAVNTTVQGSAADIVKRAMIDLASRLAAGGFEARLLLQVHDELVLEAPEGELGRLEVELRGAMEGAATLRVPLAVDIRAADNWARAHE